MTDAELDVKVRADRRPVEVRMAECCYCDQPLDMTEPMPFYTVIIAYRMRRACPTCFNDNKYLQSRWMG